MSPSRHTFFELFSETHNFIHHMNLNQIIISGDINQGLRTQEENDLMDKLGISIQYFFQKKVSSEIWIWIDPIFNEIDIFDSERRLFSGITIIGDEYPKPEFRDEDLYPVFRRSRFFNEEDQKHEGEFLPDTPQEQESEIDKLKRFDRETFENLYRFHFPWIARSIIKEGGDKQIARDVFQNALIVMLERIHSDDFKLTCISGTYLNSVSINIWRNLRRKSAQKAIEVEISDYDCNYTQTIRFEEIPEEYDRVASILEKIEDPCKSLLENFYLKGLSWDAIAEKMGYASAGSARNQKYKCIERIKRILS